MSSPAENREGYQKMVNVRQGSGGQQVSVYIPDTRRKKSPAAEARAMARTEIKEAYKAAALAEEVKAVKKQRNKLVDNLAKVGQTPSILSGTPTSYISPTVTSPTTTTSPTTASPTKVISSPVAGPVTLSGTKAFNEKINYSAPIGPVTLSGTKAFDPKLN
jgi:hypothetical protein